MNRQARIDGKVAELVAEFEARLRALGFKTQHAPASDGTEGVLLYQEVRTDGRSHATCEDTGAITEWFDNGHAPGRNGEYQVRRGNEISFEIFKNGAWAGGKPDSWRGIDWRISEQKQDGHLAVLQDKVHGSKPDSALALIRHCICANSNDRGANTLTGKFRIRAKAYYRVIKQKDSDGAKQTLHLVDPDLIESKPLAKDVLQQIEHAIETFYLPPD